jgi:hypothetical protein
LTSLAIGLRHILLVHQTNLTSNDMRLESNQVSIDLKIATLHLLPKVSYYML